MRTEITMAPRSFRLRRGPSRSRGTRSPYVPNTKLETPNGNGRGAGSPKIRGRFNDEYPEKPCSPPIVGAVCP